MGSKQQVPYGHRERKEALKRLGLLDSVLHRLERGPLADIKVVELCDEVGISEQTFFNTFGSKSSLLVYFVSLWSVEMQWRMNQADSPVAALELLFRCTAELQARWPWLMPEIITEQLQSLSRELPLAPLPARADKLIRFPTCPGIDELEPLPVEEMIAHRVSEAAKLGLVPNETGLRELIVSHLVTLFFGATLAAKTTTELSILYKSGIALMGHIAIPEAKG